MDRTELPDLTFRSHRGGDAAGPGEHASGAEFRGEPIDMRDPVQQRQDMRRGSNRRPEGIDRLLEVVGLASEDYEIAFGAQGRPLHEAHREREIAVRTP